MFAFNYISLCSGVLPENLFASIGARIFTLGPAVQIRTFITGRAGPIIIYILISESGVLVLMPHAQHRFLFFSVDEQPKDVWSL